MAKQHNLPSWVLKNCPCLEDGPISESAGTLIQALLSTTRDRSQNEDLLLRSILTYRIYHAREAIFSSQSNPVPPLRSYLKRLTDFTGSYSDVINEKKYPRRKIDLDIEVFTSGHYGTLFHEFSAEDNVKEALSLLAARFALNGIDANNFAGKSALDAGCGGGRYSFALKRLGFKKVTGIDLSEENIATCRKRAKEFGEKGLTFIQGSVLDLPFKEGEFDFVFSNGVLHHTLDWRAGIKDLLRVLKRGGNGWLYVILSPGGLFWDLCDVMRIIMWKKDSVFAKNFMGLMGCPPNRVFHILDHVMVPINLLLDRKRVHDELTKNGATDVRSLLRGAKNDDIEAIYNRVSFAQLKYGAGEGRFAFTKS